MSKIDYPLKSYHPHFNDPYNAKNPVKVRRFQEGAFKKEHDALTRKYLDSVRYTVYDIERAASTTPESILRICRRFPPDIHFTVNPKIRREIPSRHFATVTDRWVNNYFQKHYALEGTNPLYCSRPIKRERLQCFLNWADRDYL